MSKVDALRAMREEKYARLQAGAKARPAPSATKPAAPKTKAKAAPEPAAAGETCGHKSMNGRACTREPGHPQKSHRYS